MGPESKVGTKNKVGPRNGIGPENKAGPGNKVGSPIFFVGVLVAMSYWLFPIGYRISIEPLSSDFGRAGMRQYGYLGKNVVLSGGRVWASRLPVCHCGARGRLAGERGWGRTTLCHRRRCGARGRRRGKYYKSTCGHKNKTKPQNARQAQTAAY